MQGIAAGTANDGWRIDVIHKNGFLAGVGIARRILKYEIDIGISRLIVNITRIPFCWSDAINLCHQYGGIGAFESTIVATDRRQRYIRIVTGIMGSRHGYFSTNNIGLH
jgi:hypothetical protein